jgi:hypothetical protein
MIGSYRRDTSVGRGNPSRHVRGIRPSIDETGTMGQGSRLLCVNQRRRCRESSFAFQAADGRSRMSLPISLPSESVYIRLEDRKRPWSISDGVSPDRETRADESRCGRS